MEAAGSLLVEAAGSSNTRESRCKYVGVYGSSWKLPRGTFVEAAIEGSNGSFPFHRVWKLPCTSMEASTNFHGSKYTSTNFHGNFRGSRHSSSDFDGSFDGSKLTSIEVNPWKFPWTLVDVSIDVGEN